MKIEDLAKIIENQNVAIDSLARAYWALYEELENSKKNPETITSTTSARNRGPVSKKQMTEDDARKILIGELKNKSHREAGEILGLSYGQIYSARGGFTFKGIYKEAEDLKKVNK